MNYPFTAEQFSLVFSKYNNALWPAQVILYALALIAVLFVFKTNRYSSKIISAILGFLWLWMGIAYNWVFFTAINPAAWILGLVFVVEGALLLYFGFFKNKLKFKFQKNAFSYIGLAITTIGLTVYPVIGYLIGHTFPTNPTFGLPCPTTIFTLGMLLTDIGPTKRLLIIPFAWSLLGFMAAISFGIKEDVLLLVSGICAMSLVLLRDRAFGSQKT
jgi:hypothetical protein